MRITFEWNEEKAKKNLRKHKINFEEAKTVFNDPFLLTFPDREYPGSEQRFINIGNSVNERVLIVIHTERGSNIRIISCRKATKTERKVYEEGYV
ncbi:MAG: BrnT family toxin [Candidatus Scalindua sp.]